MLNSARYFNQHRLPLALAAQRNGYQVLVVAVPDHPSEVDTIRKHGFEFYPLALKRRGMNPFSELIIIKELILLFRSIKPDIIHSLTIKPVIYAGLAARILGLNMIALIPGRGSIFGSKGVKGFFFRTLANALYRVALRGSRRFTVFENLEDKRYFEERGIVDLKKTARIMGSGVDTVKFSYSAYDVSSSVKRRIILASRLLREKGIEDFINSSALVKKEFPEAEFIIAGAPDTGNPSSYSETEIIGLCNKMQITYLGYCADMPSVLKSAHIFCLPSYYAEGVPVCLLEASSLGMPVITTDMPGCRDAVLHMKTGIIVPAKSPKSIAEAIILLLRDTELAAQMGQAGSTFINDNFKKEIIIKSYLEFYNLLLTEGQIK